jgi:hypothetical protein
VLGYGFVVQLIWEMDVKYVPYVHMGSCVTTWLLRVYVRSALRGD